MDIDVQNAKIELIQWLTTLEDYNIIKQMIDFKKSKSKDWWNDISDAEKKSINLGLADAENGNLIPDSEARKIYGKWL